MGTKRAVTRRGFLKKATAAGAAATVMSLVDRFAVPAVIAQSKIDKITVGAWGGSFGQAIQASVGEAFEKQYGVKIEYARGGDSAHIAMMRAERGHQTMDVVFWTPTSASLMERELHALVPLQEKSALIPRMRDLSPSSRDPRIWTAYSVPIWTYAWTLVYRTDKIPQSTASGLNSWRAIFDERFRKRVGWPNINWGPGWGLTTLAMMAGAGTIESGKPHDVSPGWGLLPKLVPQVLTFYGGDDQAEQLLRSGDTWLTLRATFEAGLFRKQNLPIGALTTLKEGMIATNEALSIVRSGDKAREDMAARFINVALSPGPQKVLAEYYFTPINPTVQLPPPLVSQVLSVEQVNRLNHFDWIWMGTQIDKWTEKWSKMIAR